MTDTAVKSALGGDPYAAAFDQSPYHTLPELHPDDGVRAILRVQQGVQRSGLDERQDTAFRALRDVVTRASWDLVSLGTTPGIARDLWVTARGRLAQGDRVGARELFAGARPSVTSPEATHARAVLVTNELMHVRGRAEAPTERALSHFVGCWASLLARSEWLVAFARSRCATWSRTSPHVSLDAADELRFPERVEQLVLSLLEHALGDDADLHRRWRLEWERERAAIEVFARAAGRRSLLLDVPRSHGPRSLEEMGCLEGFAAGVRRVASSRAARLPLSAVYDGAVFDDTSARALEAAAALRLLYGPLGLAAASAWKGLGAQAMELVQRPFARRDTGLWYAGPVDLEESRRVLEFEALVQVFRDELSRVEVPVARVVHTASELAARAGSSPDPAIFLEAVERKVVGRAVACIEGRTVPQPGELRRVLALCREIYDLLRAQGGGTMTAGALAQLLVRRAGVVWTSCPGLPGAVDRHRILRDLFEASDLAPHNVEIIEVIVSIAAQVHSTIESRAEAADLLRRALSCVERCEAASSAHDRLRSSRQRLEEIMDPEKTLGRAWEDVMRILSEEGPRS
jgi:hypothetical protein